MTEEKYVMPTLKRVAEMVCDADTESILTEYQVSVIESYLVTLADLLFDCYGDTQSTMKEFYRRSKDIFEMYELDVETLREFL